MNSKPSKTKFKIQRPGMAIMWFFLGVAFVVLLSLASKSFDNQPIESIEVNIQNQKDTRFLTKESVTTKVLDYLGTELSALPVNQINLEEMKAHLERNPYIEEVDLFVDMKRRINIDIWQKFPILRVVTGENDYYLSNHGYKIPKSSDFTSRVLVATGYITDNKRNTGKISQKEVFDLYNLASFIYDDDVLHAMIEQVYVHEDKQIELVSKLSSHEILIGDIDNLEEKMMSLKVFFKEVAEIEGWDTHKKIDLTWPNKVIAAQ